MRAVAGIWMIGITPGMLQRKMKRKRLSRNGVHLRPDLPSVCITTLSSMNSIVTSARLRTPVGATIGSRREARRNNTMPINAAATAMRAILLNVGKMSCQRRSLVDRRKLESEHVVSVSVVSVGGVGECRCGHGRRCSDPVGLRPGCASDRATYFISQNSRPRCVTMMVDPSAGNEIHAASLHQPDGEEDQPEADQVAEQHGAPSSGRARSGPTPAMSAAASAKLTSTMAMP